MAKHRTRENEYFLSAILSGNALTYVKMIFRKKKKMPMQGMLFRCANFSAC